jgi:Regulator of ribonuclease activity B
MQIRHLFYLYFPAEADARAAAAQIAGEQTAQSIHFDSGSLDGPTKDRASWMVQLTAHMTPELARVKRIGEWLEAVAQKHRGEYDGWEAAVKK